MLVSNISMATKGVGTKSYTDIPGHQRIDPNWRCVDQPAMDALGQF